MYRQHVSPQTQNKRTSSLICGAKRRTGARIATFGLSVLVAGQLMLPGMALAAEMPETVAGQDAAATAVADPAAPVIAKQAAVAPAATADVAASSVMGMLSWQHPLQLRLNLHLQRPRIQLKPKQPSRLQAIRPLRQHLNLSMSHLRPQQHSLAAQPIQAAAKSKSIPP